MMKNRFLAFLLAGLLLGGCAGQKEATKPTETQTPPATTAPSTSGAGAAQQATGQALDPFEDPANPLSHRVIYFDYDSAEVKPQDLDIVNAHARYLASHASARVRLEGHADERGSREYNVALSERRALSVKRLMLFQGVRPDQITVVAYGEERPVALCHNESCWSKNRRVEIVYESR